MKKRLLFIISRFLDGGIDTVLLEYLRMFASDERYSLTLAIGCDMGDLEVFRENVPQGVKVVHLVTNPLLCRFRMRRYRKQCSIAGKALGELFLTPVERWQKSRALHRLAECNDVVIDFDACQTAFLQGCTKTKIAWLHFSLTSLMQQNRMRTDRILKRFHGNTHVVTLSNAMTDELNRLCPSLNSKVTHLYNPANRQRLLDRATEPLDYNHRFILTVGRLDETDKDNTNLLHAYSKCDTDCKLVIVGKGKDEPRLRQLAEELGIADRVFFAGFQMNPYKWMARADLVVLSSKFEGLPTVLIEALLLGKPLLATDCPVGPREILADGKAGMLVPVGDPDALAKGMKTMLEDEAMRTRLLEYARQHSLIFKAESIKAQLEKLFA